MKIIPNEFYHVYNQGNNKEKIFSERSNYLHFLKLVRSKIFPFADILSYCLMPNHFHFLLRTTDLSAHTKKVGALEVSLLMDGFRQLLSSYAQAFNNRKNRSGSLFRQKTKAKQIEDKTEAYLFNVFNYIHQNPVKAGLVTYIEDWEYSSYLDYAGIRNGTLCNQKSAEEFLAFNKEQFLKESYLPVEFEKIKSAFLGSKKKNKID